MSEDQPEQTKAKYPPLPLFPSLLCRTPPRETRILRIPQLRRFHSANHSCSLRQKCVRARVAQPGRSSVSTLRPASPSQPWPARLPGQVPPAPGSPWGPNLPNRDQAVGCQRRAVTSRQNRGSRAPKSGQEAAGTGLSVPD